ncbi:MAG: phosphoenolpyruvate--protein phosphotransferase [Planctomycetota bacterium]|nr:MAG: phosphoenolpyruvate--protein phosphotransferase [Planctomycetota bacterium]
MLELSGIAVSPGMAIGKALILDREGYRITRTEISPHDCENECKRLDQAVREASAQLDARQARAAEVAGQRVGAIFSAHQQLLLDPVVRAEWERLIREQCVSAEYAVSSVLNRFAQAFRQLGSEMLVERVNDIRDVEQTLLEALGGTPLQICGDADGAILLSHDLTPGETARLDADRILGFCTEVGGPGAHTAIVARGMNLPAVVAVGAFLHRIRSDSLIILDGFTGRVIIDPDPEVLAEFRRAQMSHRDRSVALGRLRDVPAETLDGRRVTMLANIEFPNEATAGFLHGAEGIGLYRTEFLYLGRDDPPGLDEQLAAYRDVVARAEGRPVVMRTLDLGADKLAGSIPAVTESNPVLGLRSIRLSLRQPDVFRKQIRAMLQAAADGPVKIMFPMIATVAEWECARRIVDDEAEQLSRQGWQPAEHVEVGMMLEVPAAIVLLDRFIESVDFVSIGTNDLIQYTMAVDRGNEWVADLYAPFDPAVLRLIRAAVEVADGAGKPISVCGEMSSSPDTAALLIGLGVATLSAPPNAVPRVKSVVRQIQFDDCRRVAQQALQCAGADQVRDLVHSFLRSKLSDDVGQEVLQL